MVVGLALSQARRVLAGAGALIKQVEITRPPGTETQAPEDILRVVQQRPTVGKEICLVVAQPISLEVDSDFKADG